MKKLLGLTLFFVLLFSCKKEGLTNEQYCDNAITNVYSVMEKSLPPKDLEEMKTKFKKDEWIKECVKKFDTAKVDCLINAKTTKDVGECK